MGDNNYTNTEDIGRETNNRGEGYQGNQFADDNSNINLGEFYNRTPPMGIPDDGRVQRANPRSFNQGANIRMSRSPYQANMPNSRSYGMAYGNADYPANNMPRQGNYYKGADRMDYSERYGREDGRYMPYPYYHHDHDHYCDYYYNNMYYNRRSRPMMRPRRMPVNPPMQEYDYDCYQGMPQNPWWNQNMLNDFINRPNVNDFLRGVGIATVGLILAPTVAKTLRPILVKAVQGAMTASEELKSVFVDAKEEFEDIFAEAKWEGNNQESGKPNENKVTVE